MKFDQKMLTRTLILGLLFFLFSALFGVSQFDKFMEGGVTAVVTRELQEEGLELPAITICPLSTDKKTGIKSGWKNATIGVKQRTDPDFYTKQCESTNFLDVMNCIKTRTYSFDEIVHSVNVPFNLSSDVTIPFHGFCHTLTFPNPLNPNKYCTILLNKDHDYNFYLHDPNYFLVNSNPEAISRLRLRSENVLSLDFISVTKHIKLNRPRNSCKNGFTKCINDFVYKSAGCWLITSSSYGRGKRACNTLEQLAVFTQNFVHLFSADETEVLAMTGCAKSCEYLEYSIKERLGTRAGQGKTFLFASHFMTVIKEVSASRLLQIYIIHSSLRQPILFFLSY